MPTAIDQLQLQAAAWGISLGSYQLSLLHQYACSLAEYELANIIGTRDQDAIILEHLLDSISCLLIEDLTQENTLIDIGTGGGLPGVPLGIVRPDLEVTLLEATRKKVRFLQHIRSTLELGNLKVLNARAEHAGREEYKEHFDLATARALAALPVVAEYGAPLVRLGGTLVAMKGELTKEELCAGTVASQELGMRLRAVRPVEYRQQLVPKKRSLVVFDKIERTPDTFPRRVGLAKKRPLGA